MRVIVNYTVYLCYQQESRECPTVVWSVINEHVMVASRVT